MSRILIIACIILAVFVVRANAHPYAPPAWVKRPICSVFGRHCEEALRVSWCESRYSTNARNGQYLGLFQMGNWERQTYGHGSTASAQAVAAYRYWVASGRDWSPWSCKP